MNASAFRQYKRACSLLLFVFLLLPIIAAYPSRALAAAPGSLYSYDFTGGSAAITNSAATNTSVSMALQGDWSATGFGTLFEGNTTNKQSVGYAKPASGSTINIPKSQAVGASMLFTYKAPSSGLCFSDSPNMTQIGKFGTNLAQFKLQLSNCGKSSTNVYPQCRVAGSSTPTSVLPVTGTQALTDGEVYIVQCVKSADPVTGKASLELRTTRVDAINGNAVTTNVFSIATTGVIDSKQYLSVANKYPLPSQSNNTDQFNGEVARLAYCTGADIAAVRVCLDAEVAQ